MILQSRRLHSKMAAWMSIMNIYMHTYIQIHKSKFIHIIKNTCEVTSFFLLHLKFNPLPVQIWKIHWVFRQGFSCKFGQMNSVMKLHIGSNISFPRRFHQLVSSVKFRNASEESILFLRYNMCRQYFRSFFFILGLIV